MTRVRDLAWSVVVLCVVPAVAAAAEEAHGAEAVGAIPSAKQGFWTAVTALVVFAVVFGVLGAKVWPTLTKALDERASKIREEIESAEAARAQAKAALEQYEKALAQARAEAQKMLDAAKADQQKFAAELKAKAEAEAAALKDKAMREIEVAKRAAVNDMYTQAAGIGLQVAGKVLRREVRADDQDRLVQDCLTELASAGKR